MAAYLIQFYNTVMKKRTDGQVTSSEASKEILIDNTDINQKIPKYTISEKGNMSLKTHEFESNVIDMLKQRMVRRHKSVIH